MKLKALLRDVQITTVCADAAAEILGVSYDSRTTAPGDLFVAVPGAQCDGSCFITQAMDRGAACVVCQQPPEGDAPYVVVPSARRALAVIAANWFGRPAEEMTMVGVTGTNGKTTTTVLIKHILEQKAAARVGLVGTVENMVDRRSLLSERTTPGAWELQRLLRHMADNGCSHVVMEVSSHALALDRVYGIRFAVGLCTNLTQDHLDFHDTMERYCAAKARLLRSCDGAVCNADDPWTPLLLQGSTCPRFTFGMGEGADLQAREVQYLPDRVDFVAKTPWEEQLFTYAVPGSFSVYNALAATAVCSRLGVSLADCAEVLGRDRGARGRMEVVPTPQRDYTVLIDYAHTPDALENVLTAVRAFTAGRVIAVFGCGGDRDRAKRPLMGAIAAQLADVAVVTTDNPRSEEPMAIIREIVAGMGETEPVVIEDRRAAVRWALEHGAPGDVIVLCGKGHEPYQEVRGQRCRLDEREIVAEYLKER
ncbi:MAG: UDP-N-acetylmuramoyl-L-alanyl-D-glutamate--2,6-diaminopimelate ligase [Oscillospiraceae bacterium]|nr:UDP-N-acetylmuramoyl-L-alanyl-D-glutamate--2,6-diaminopimelate ligase [Oscillospiraceae bacterium]